MPLSVRGPLPLPKRCPVADRDDLAARSAPVLGAARAIVAGGHAGRAGGVRGRGATRAVRAVGDADRLAAQSGYAGVAGVAPRLGPRAVRVSSALPSRQSVGRGPPTAHGRAGDGLAATLPSKSTSCG